MSAPHAITKIMSASEHEFERSLAIVLGRDVRAAELPLTVALGAGCVIISRQPLEGVRLGGLLALPRSAVSLTFKDTQELEREQFLARFDLAFQRGGG